MTLPSRAQNGIIKVTRARRSIGADPPAGEDKHVVEVPQLRVASLPLPLRLPGHVEAGQGNRYRPDQHRLGRDARESGPVEEFGVQGAVAEDRLDGHRDEGESERDAGEEGESPLKIGDAQVVSCHAQVGQG